MKLLLVADWHGEIYAQAFYNAFKALGVDVYKFSWKEYFKHYQYSHAYPTESNVVKSIYYRFQNKFLIGPTLLKINKDLIDIVNKIKPELVFIYRGTHVYPETIRNMKKKLKNLLIFGYNNDDPFSNKYPSYFWRHFKQSIPFYDHIFVFRPKNIHDLAKINYHKTSILRAYYIKEKNFPITNNNDIRNRNDVIFIGHFENDGRDDAIKILIDNNINVKLFGTNWEKSKHYNFFKNKFGVIKPVYGDAYNTQLNSSKIALVFLSKLNNDTCTRRCFEIPATKTMMLSEFSEELATLFKEGVEAEYFRNHNELLIKVKHYLSNPDKIVAVGVAGYERLIKDGHEVTDRCKEILRVYNNYK